MRNKKGQIAIAIILSVILLISVGLMMYLKPKTIADVDKILIDVPEQAKPVAFYVQECVKNVAPSGIYLLGAQGGYIFPPYEGIELNDLTIAYGYKEGEKTLPSITEMEFQLSSYIANAVVQCANFSVFENQGFEVSAAEITAKTIITKNTVIVEVDYPLIVKKEGFETRLGTFGTVIPARLGNLHDIASSIIAKEIENPDVVDFTYLSELDSEVSIVTHDESQFIYSITDALSTYLGDPLIFMFANRFKVNLAPEIQIPDTVNLLDGVLFTIYVKAVDPENDTLTFSDDTALFDISPRGFINITPEIPGEYDVKITVEDTKGNSDSKTVKFLVAE